MCMLYTIWRRCKKTRKQSGWWGHLRHYRVRLLSLRRSKRGQTLPVSGRRKERKKREINAHTGTYTQGMLRRLQFAQVDLPSHLIFRPKFGLGQYHQTRMATRRTSAKLAGHRRPPRGNLLFPRVEDRVLLLLGRWLVVVDLGRE